MADNATSLADRAGAPIERPLPLPSGNALFGSDVVAETLRALEVPFIALNPGASYRGLHDSLVNYLGNVQPQMLLCLHEEHAVAIAHGYAKVTGTADGRRGALQCRADARDDGDVQRLVRPHAGAGARRDRSGGCAEAPAVDRLDPHRARSGRADPRLHQVGRSARLGRGGAGVAAARLLAGAIRRRKAPVYINLDAGMQEAPLADPLPPIDASRFVPDVVSAVRAGAGGTRGGDAARGEAAGDPDGARLARRAGMGQSRGAGRDAARPRGDRSEMRRGVSHRPSAACRRAGDVPGAGGGAGHRRRRCHPEPRLGRSGGRAEGGVRHGLAGRQR